MRAVQFYKTEMPVKGSSENTKKQDKTEDFLEILKKAPDKLKENDGQDEEQPEDKEKSVVQSTYFVLPQELQTTQMVTEPLLSPQAIVSEQVLNADAQGITEGMPEQAEVQQNVQGVSEPQLSVDLMPQNIQMPEQVATTEKNPKAEGIQLPPEVKTEEPVTDGSASLPEAGKTVDVLPTEQTAGMAVAKEENGEGRVMTDQDENSRRDTKRVDLAKGLYETASPVKNFVGEKAKVTAQSVVHVTKPEELPQELAKQLLIRTSTGQNEFEIQVTPEHLGKIVVRVMYEEGVSTVSILCSEKRTMELLAQSAREIGTVMEQNLGKPTEVYVEKQETENPWQEQQDNNHAGRDSEQRRQKEEQEKMRTAGQGRFLQELRLGLR